MLGLAGRYIVVVDGWITVIGTELEETLLCENRFLQRVFKLVVVSTKVFAAAN